MKSFKIKEERETVKYEKQKKKWEIDLSALAIIIIINNYC